jgi:hypothetical protein
MIANGKRMIANGKKWGKGHAYQATIGAPFFKAAEG